MVHRANGRSDASGLAGRIIAALKAHCDRVLRIGRDTWNGTPLLADGFDTVTNAPAVWTGPDGSEMVMSNFASQQHFMRTLCGLSALSGDERYEEAARETASFMFAHQQDESGLLHWGGHRMIDLKSGMWYGLDNLHELKCHYPFYNLLFRAAPDGARRFVEAFWDRHVLDWSNLDENRHGAYGRRSSKRSVPLWKDDFANGPVFFTGKGLTFINAGSDLYQAGVALSSHTNNPSPMLWARRLASRYVRTRHPATGLSGYQFSCVEWGDRARTQFGPEFGERALESTVLDSIRSPRKFGNVAVMTMLMARALGHGGDEFLTWTIEDLTAYLKFGYDREHNLFRALLTDGTVLTPAHIVRKGYYTPEQLSPWPPPGVVFRAVALAYHLSVDDFLRDAALSMQRGPLSPGSGKHGGILDDGHVDYLHGLLDLYAVRREQPFLDAAVSLASGLLADRFAEDLIVESRGHRFICFNRREPVALLRLAGVLTGKEHLVPDDLAGQFHFTAPMRQKRRTSDYIELWPVLKNAAA